MMRKSLARAAIAVLATSWMACAGTEKIRNVSLTSKDEEIALDASYDDSKGACRKAMQRTGFTVVEEREVDRDTWLIVGDLGAGLKSWGQFARIVVVRDRPNVTHALVLSVKKIDMNRSEDLEGVRRRLVLNIHQALAE